MTEGIATSGTNDTESMQVLSVVPNSQKSAKREEHVDHSVLVVDGRRILKLATDLAKKRGELRANTTLSLHDERLENRRNAIVHRVLVMLALGFLAFCRSSKDLLRSVPHVGLGLGIDDAEVEVQEPS